MIPLIIAGATLAAQLAAKKSEEEKQAAYEKQVAAQSMREQRRKALVDAIGARSLGVTEPTRKPDVSSERVLGAISGLIGQAAASNMGGQSSGSPQASPAPQMSFGDPSEAIKRRLMNSYDPYGGQSGIA